MLTLRSQVQDVIAQAGLGFKEVGGAANLNIVEGQQIRLSTPGCYVIRDGINARENEMITAVRQKQMVQIGVVIAVRNVANATGLDSSDTAEEFSDAIKNLLVGYAIDDYAPFEYQRGQIVSFNNGFLFWRDVYQTYNYVMRPKQ